MAEGRLIPASRDDVIDLALAASVTGYVGAAETAKALQGVIGAEAVLRIERAMISALDRMIVAPEIAAAVNREIREIFSRAD